jgi:hypothetical protein
MTVPWHPHEARIFSALFDEKGNKAGYFRLRFVNGRGSFPMTGYGTARWSNTAYKNRDHDEREEVFAAVRGLYIATVVRIPFEYGEAFTQAERPSFSKRVTDALTRAQEVAHQRAIYYDGG